jgi:hypothetical protein
MKKYLCIGGEIISKNDNELHYISTYQLAALYKVNPKDCYFVRDSSDPLLEGLDIENLIVLRPSYNGNYKTISAMLKKLEQKED